MIINIKIREYFCRSIHIVCDGVMETKWFASLLVGFPSGIVISAINKGDIILQHTFDGDTE